MFLLRHGVADALHGNLRGGALNLARVLGCQAKVSRAPVFFRRRSLCGAGNGHEPGRTTPLLVQH